MKSKFFQLVTILFYFLSFSANAQTLFWSEPGATLNSKDLKTGEESIIFETNDFITSNHINALALDKENQKIYFALHSLNPQQDRLMVIDYNGNNLTELAVFFTANSMDFHVEEKLIYYTTRNAIKIEDYGIRTIDPITGIDELIYPCTNCINLKIDESDNALLFNHNFDTKKLSLDDGVTEDLDYISTIDEFGIDETNNQIYWSSGGFSTKLFRVNYDGTNKDTLFQSENSDDLSKLYAPYVCGKSGKLYYYWEEKPFPFFEVIRTFRESNLDGSDSQILGTNTFLNDNYEFIDDWEIDENYPNDKIAIEIDVTHYTLDRRELTKSKLNQTIPFKVCADGSQGSIFDIEFKEDIDLSNIILRIQEDPNGNDVDKYGSFSNIAPILSDLSISYKHPQYVGDVYLPYVNINMQIIDISTNEILGTFPIQIYRAPVIMVHGLWGKPSAFHLMRDELLKSKLYENFMLLLVDYEMSNDSSFNHNHQEKIIKKHINNLLTRTYLNKLSSNKVDIIAHSMGGILSRLYMKSPQYKEDVNKLITCNTPHFGSQIANLLFDPEFRCYSTHICRVLNLKLGSCYNGGVEDLQVDNIAISLLNQNNSKGFFSHSIVTTESLTNLVDYSSGENVGLIDMFTLLLTVGLDVTLSEVFDNNSHDLIVADLSQKGGLEDEFITNISKQWHVGSVANSELIDTTKKLLNVNPNNKYFTKNGFGVPPESFDYSSVNICSSEPQIQANLTINSPQEGTIFFTGQTIEIDVLGSNDLKKVAIAIDHKEQDIIHLKEFNSNSGKLIYEISKGLLGERKIIVLGYDKDNKIICVNSSSIFVESNEKPISIKPLDSLFVIAKGEKGRVFFEADFGTSKAYISELEDLEFVFSSGKASRVEKNTIRGDELGEDTLIIKYKGVESQPIRIHVYQSSSDNTTSINTPIFSGNKLDLKISKLFPNPSQNDFLINFNSSKIQDVKIQLVDLSGKPVFSSTFKAMQGENLTQVILPETLSSGIYFVNLRGEFGFQVAKFIKQ